ncbi:MAG: LURP-one-related family protein [Streptococcaceae bacterium]|jgi:uncharacterized protein YxjI|nr:LURP-one-related family protein [Streptococcaceae bacterium]
MPKLIVNSKIFSLGGEMWITDGNETPLYSVKGSFLKIPKFFTIYDAAGNERAKVTHKVLSLLPKFFLEIDGQEAATISKRLTLFKAKYDVEAHDIQLNGNILDMNFEILRHGQVIGRIDKQWFSIRDKYMIEVENKEDELLVLSLVLAVDYVKREESNTGSTSYY